MATRTLERRQPGLITFVVVNRAESEKSPPPPRQSEQLPARSRELCRKLRRVSAQVVQVEDMGKDAEIQLAFMASLSDTLNHLASEKILVRKAVEKNR